MLPETSYTVRVRLAAPAANNAALAALGRFPTGANQGTDDAVDSDASLNGMAATLTATTGVADTFDDTFDFGFQPELAQSLLGDRVWLDNDGDGVQDNGEPGIDGVLVALRDDANNLIGTTTTAGGGLYQFSNKQDPPLVNDASDWKVQILLNDAQLAGLALSPLNQGGNDAADSDGEPNLIAGSAVARILPTTPSDGNNDLTRDFGFAPLRIGDFVWRDANGDGVQQAGEPGLGNVQLDLRETSTNTLIGSTTTNANGRYFFSSADFPAMVPGTEYTVQVRLNGRLPARHQPTGVDRGADDAADSDGVANAARTRAEHTRTAPSALGQSDLTVDFGFAPCFTLGDRIW